MSPGQGGAMRIIRYVFSCPFPLKSVTYSDAASYVEQSDAEFCKSIYFAPGSDSHRNQLECRARIEVLLEISGHDSGSNTAIQAEIIPADIFESCPRKNAQTETDLSSFLVVLLVIYIVPDT